MNRMNTETLNNDVLHQSYTSLPEVSSKPSLQPQQSNKSLEISHEYSNHESTILQDQNKDLNKKISALHKQVHKLEESCHLKDQEIMRLKRVKQYKHYPEAKQQDKKPIKGAEKTAKSTQPRSAFDKPT